MDIKYGSKMETARIFLVLLLAWCSNSFFVTFWSILLIYKLGMPNSDSL